jgi:hypothetical protein
MNYIKFLLIIVSIAFADISALPTQQKPVDFAQERIIPMTSEEGKKLFKQSEYREAYWRISRHFEAQQKTNTCGVASSVIAMNALGIEQSVHKAGWTQEDFFTEQVKNVISPDIVDQRGMNLRELKTVLETYKVKAAIFYWDENNEGELRSILKDSLQDPDKVVIANYFRPALGLPGEGHYSPIGAYNLLSDFVLVMDVAENNPPPAWVRVDDLLSSMKPVYGKVRGFLVISKTTYQS